MKKEVVELIYQKNKFEYNKKLLNKIQNGDFDENEFNKMGKNKIKKITLNSIKDNKKFEINSVELLYSLQLILTMINDEKDNIYLAKIKSFI